MEIIFIKKMFCLIKAAPFKDRLNVLHAVCLKNFLISGEKFLLTKQVFKRCLNTVRRCTNMRKIFICRLNDFHIDSL